MDPLVSAMNIIRIAVAIAGHIETIKFNNRQWSYLQQRVSTIKNIMGVFLRLYNDNTPIPDAYKEPLLNMEAVLNEALEKIVSFQAQKQRSRITKAIFLADYYERSLTFLNTKISNAMLALSLGLSMQEVIEKKGQTEELKKIAEKKIAALQYKLEPNELKDSKIISFCEVSIEALLLESSRVKAYTGYCFKDFVTIRLLKGVLTAEDRHEFMQEAQKMDALSSPYILPVYHICVEPSSLCLITKYTPQGSLKELLHKVREKGLPLSPQYQYQWGIDIALGLYYLHKEDYTHRKLTSKSVFIDKDGHALLAGFHLSQKNILNIFWDEENSIIEWTAPELLANGEAWTLQPDNANVYRFGDIYSFGMVLWEIMTGNVPYQDWDKKILPMRILNGEREIIPPFVPENYSEIIKNCWEKDWVCRKSISGIVDLLRSFNSSKVQVSKSDFLEMATKKEDGLENRNYVELIDRVVGVENEDQIEALKSEVSQELTQEVVDVEKEEGKSGESTARLLIDGVEEAQEKASLSQITVKKETDMKKSIDVLEDKSTLKKFSDSKEVIAKRTLKHTRRSDSETSTNEAVVLKELNDFQLGKMYAEGRGVKQNTATAIQLLMKAAQSGKQVSEARFYLGLLFAEGLYGCNRNEATAMYWFNSIATELVGLDRDSLYYLGVIYERGYIKKAAETDYKDETKAREYFLNAAQQGHGGAQYHLAVMCLQGRGGNLNEKDAINWFKQAACQGYTCGVGAEIISKEMPKLIAAIIQILGQNYKEDVGRMFSQLWHEGIPLLKEETVYNYKYEIYSSKKEIPPVKKRGIVYLYVENRMLHYQIVRQQEVRSGTLKVEAGFNLDKLADVCFIDTLPTTEKIRQIWYSCAVPQTTCIYKISTDNGSEVKAYAIDITPQDSMQEVEARLLEFAREQKWCLSKEENLLPLEKEFERQLKEKGELEPSYEVNFALKMLPAYKEILTKEIKFLEFLNRLLSTLQLGEFKELFEDPQDISVLENAIVDLQKLRSDQVEISGAFKQNPSDSSEIIAILKSVYEDKINFENYLKMARFINFLHAKLNKIGLKDKIYSLCQKNDVVLSSNVLTNLPAIFTAQFITRKIMLLNNFAHCFRKKHEEIYQLDRIFFALKKLVTLIERAQPPSSQPEMQDEKINLESMKEIHAKLNKEKNDFKNHCFKLIKPIFNLLMLEIDRIDMAVILRTFLIQKRDLMSSFSFLEERSLGNEERIKKIEKIKREIDEAQDLVYLIACIIDLLTLIPTLFPEVNAVKNIESTDLSFIDLPFFQTPDSEPVSPRQRRVSRMDDLLEKLSPRYRQTPLKERNSPGTTGRNSVPLSPSFFLNDSFNKTPNLDGKRKKMPLALAQSSGLLGSPAQSLVDKEGSFLSAIHPLSLEDKEEKRSLTESCDGISRARRSNNPHNSFFEGRKGRNRVFSFSPPPVPTPTSPILFLGPKVEESVGEDSNKASRKFSLSQMTSPRGSHPSKPAVIANEEQPRSSMSPTRTYKE